MLSPSRKCAALASSGACRSAGGCACATSATSTWRSVWGPDSIGESSGHTTPSHCNRCRQRGEQRPRREHQRVADSEDAALGPRPRPRGGCM